MSHPTAHLQRRKERVIWIQRPGAGHLPLADHTQTEPGSSERIGKGSRRKAAHMASQ